MKTRYTVALSMIVGAALGSAAIQGLHAQAKLKAYTVSELETIDAQAQQTYLPAARKAIEAAHGRPLRHSGRKGFVHIEGAPAPKSAAIVEWDSLDDAVAFYKSKAWTDLAPQRDKHTKDPSAICSRGGKIVLSGSAVHQGREGHSDWSRSTLASFVPRNNIV